MATLDAFGQHFDAIELDPGEGGEDFIPTVIVAGSTRCFRPAPVLSARPATDKRANTGCAPPRLIAARHAARSRAAARVRRVRDEDLALGGRPRLHAGNCQASRHERGRR